MHKSIAFLLVISRAVSQDEKTEQTLGPKCMQQIVSNLERIEERSAPFVLIDAPAEGAYYRTTAEETFRLRGHIVGDHNNTCVAFRLHRLGLAWFNSRLIVAHHVCMTSNVNTLHLIPTTGSMSSKQGGNWRRSWSAPEVSPPVA